MMTRRDFVRLLSGSGLLVAGSSSLGMFEAWAQEAPGAPVGLLPEAVNPILPYLGSHPFPWPVPGATPGTQKFDLLNWSGPPGGGGRASDIPSGTLTIQPQTSAGGVTYSVVRTTPDDVLTTQFQCAADAWHTPQSWTAEMHPTMKTPFPISATLAGSLANGKLTTGRGPDIPVTVPVTTMAALTGSIPVLEQAAKSGTTFYALTESGAVLGPLQASARPPIMGPDQKPMFQVVALWGPRMLPSHVVYDSAGTAVFTGLLMSGVRSTT
jgi:hypothetical protein